MRDLFPQMERLVTDSFRAVGSKIDPQRVSNCFEIFGYDFMIDEQLKVWLIEVNTNPCLEESSPILEELLPRMLDDAFRLTIDKIYPPPQPKSQQKSAQAEKLRSSKGLAKAGSPQQ